MEHFPKDVLILLAMEMHYPEILNFCRTNKKIDNAVCKNENFWRNKLHNKDEDLKNVIGRKILDSIPLTDKTVPAQLRGFLAPVRMKPELVSFILNTDLGNYKINEMGKMFSIPELNNVIAKYLENEGLPIKYILKPLLNKSVLSRYVAIKLLKDYFNKYRYEIDGRKFYKVGPEMNHYLDKQLTELENDQTHPFNRNKFKYTDIQRILGKALFPRNPLDVYTPEEIKDLKKFQEFLEKN